MKLRNKKTGEIADLAKRGLLKSDNDNHIIVYPDGALKYYAYNSLAELNEEWEDYKPVEPLIEDQKTRKVFREWTNLFGAKRFRVDHLCNFGRTIFMSIDLVEEPEIGLPGFIGKDSETYTKVELCGEE